MIEMKFNPWDEVIDIVRSRWPELKAEIYFTDTEWEWSAFPSGTVWFPEGSDVATIRISFHVPFMETVEILAKSLAYLAFNHDSGQVPEVLNDERAEVYFNWIYDEYMQRIENKDRLQGAGSGGEENVKSEATARVSIL